MSARRSEPWLGFALAAALCGCMAKIEGPPAPAPVELPDAGVTVPPSLPPPQAELTLGDRDYIASVLKEIFTPTGHEPYLDDVLRTEIRASIGLFGGACNVYSSAGLSDCGLQQATQYQTNDVTAPARQPTSAAREARRLRACEQIVDRPAAIEAALMKIPKASLDRVPDATQLAAAFDLFYPGQPMPAEAQQALAALVNDVKNTPGESWQLLLLALCQSPGWQLP
jgi:hypothetical protein